ncbi:MAG: M56 family metallopeptidase [Oscillospiraceae bacterium]|jgi:beta-lactamase regulating signal transducer with metallopeptidase domain|nr:M56 family metallopeptidase [Oscillospiraceae bacterium]
MEVETLRTILTMSIAGGAITLVLLALRPLIKDRLPKAFQYYVWVALVAVLLVPFSRIVVLPEAIETPIIAESVSRYIAAPRDLSGGLEPQQPNFGVPVESGGQVERTVTPRRAVETADLLWLLYPLGAAVFLGYNLAGYLAFVRKLKKSAAPASERELELLRKLAGKRKAPRLAHSALAPTPLLTGLLLPVIYLPERVYSDARLRNILLHELSHLRRGDIFIKWLAVVAGAVHWFNPLVYLARRELDKSCELACDELVIKGFDLDGRQDYGDTLIAAASERRLPSAVLSTTLGEEKKQLKERLRSIMKHKKFSKFAIIVSIIILMGVVLGAAALGAGSREKDEAPVSESDAPVTGSMETQAVDASSIDQAFVQDAAEELVSNRFGELLSGPLYASVGFDLYDDWRIESLEYLGAYDGEDIDVVAYELHAQFHCVAPERLAMAGSMTVAEDGWVAGLMGEYVLFETSNPLLLGTMSMNECVYGSPRFYMNMVELIALKTYTDELMPELGEVIVNSGVSDRPVVLPDGRTVAVSYNARRFTDESGRLSFDVDGVVSTRKFGEVRQDREIVFQPIAEIVPGFGRLSFNEAEDGRYYLVYWDGEGTLEEAVKASATDINNPLPQIVEFYREEDVKAGDEIQIDEDLIGLYSYDSDVPIMSFVMQNIAKLPGDAAPGVFISSKLGIELELPAELTEICEVVQETGGLGECLSLYINPRPADPFLGRVGSIYAFSRTEWEREFVPGGSLYFFAGFEYKILAENDEKVIVMGFASDAQADSNTKENYEKVRDAFQNGEYTVRFL